MYIKLSFTILPFVTCAALIRMKSHVSDRVLQTEKKQLRTRGLSRRSWSPATTGPPGPSVANYVTVDGPPGPSMAAMDGPLCLNWSPGSKPEKQWLQLQIDLYIY